MKKKNCYLAPEAELLEIYFEGNFCQTGVPGGPGADDPIVDDKDDLN